MSVASLGCFYFRLEAVPAFSFVVFGSVCGLYATGAELRHVFVWACLYIEEGQGVEEVIWT